MEPVNCRIRRILTKILSLLYLYDLLKVAYLQHKRLRNTKCDKSNNALLKNVSVNDKISTQ